MFAELLRRVYRLRYTIRYLISRRDALESLPRIYLAPTSPEVTSLGLAELRCELSDRLISSAAEYIFDPPYLSKVDDVTIVPPAGYAVTKDRKIICQPHFTARFLVDVLPYKDILNRFHAAPAKYIPAAYYLLGPWHRNYYHWLIDYCPHIESLYEYKKLDPDLPILMPAGLPDAYQQLLKILWKGTCIEWNGEVLSVATLIVPSTRKGKSSPRRIEGSPLSLSSIGWLNDKVRPHLRSIASCRLFVSRQNSEKARLGNERALFERLRDLGFTKVTLEELPFLDQASLFHSAQMVIGCHGAGLANIVFCNPGTPIVEIYPEGIARQDYYSLARLLRMKYFGVIANRRNGRFEVDVDGVASIAAKALG